jgi:hypothetical protein
VAVQAVTVAQPVRVAVAHQQQQEQPTQAVAVVVQRTAQTMAVTVVRE